MPGHRSLADGAELTACRSRRVAIHEAGHAVAGEFFGVRVKRVCVTSLTTGYTEYDLRSLPCRRDPFICAVLSLAGSVAEHQYAGLKRTMFDEADARRADGMTRGSKKRWMAARDLAWSIVGGHAEEILNVAAVLLKRNITGEELRRIIGHSK